MTRVPKIRMKRSVIHREPETDSARTAETAETSLARGQCLTDQSTLYYNSFDGQGQLLWLVLSASQFWTTF